jgi:Protein of unknown function (DUF3108)
MNLQPFVLMPGRYIALCAVLFVFCMSLPLSAFAKELPRQIKIEYSLRKAGVALGTASETLSRQGDRYTIESEARGLAGLLGNIQRKSQGSVTSQGLRPVLYEDRRNGKPYATARFNWENKQVSLEREGKPKKVNDIEGEIHDPLTLAYSFAFRAMPIAELSFGLANGRRLKPHRLQFKGKEKLATPLGEVETLRFAEREDDGSATEIWLSGAHEFLPVRVLYVDDDGAMLDQIATKISLQD